MREVSERSATLGALAHQEEQRAEGLVERQQKLAEQQGKVRTGYRSPQGGRGIMPRSSKGDTAFLSEDGGYQAGSC